MYASSKDMNILGNVWKHGIGKPNHVDSHESLYEVFKAVENSVFLTNDTKLMIVRSAAAKACQADLEASPCYEKAAYFFQIRRSAMALSARPRRSANCLLRLNRS
jgi:hypothetical protein